VTQFLCFVMINPGVGTWNQGFYANEAYTALLPPRQP